MEEREINEPMTDDEYRAWIETQPEPLRGILKAKFAIAVATDLVLSATPTADIAIDWAVVVSDIKKLNLYADSFCNPQEIESAGWAAPEAE